MVVKYRCKSEQRLSRIRTQPAVNGQLLNGIDYLEVTLDLTTLAVHFAHNLPGEEGGVPQEPILTTANVVIQPDPPTRKSQPKVQVESVSSSGKILTIRLNQPGDLSAYQLQIVNPSTESEPPNGFDSQLAQVKFFFQSEPLSEFDCQVPELPSADSSPLPIIDYLAKDYASFRRLILDRLAVIMPQWRERSPADIGIMLVELLAYAADYLSYYQDAIATEAYLGTARKRVSVRRHARLLDYQIHDGSNARTWVAIKIPPDLDGEILPKSYDLRSTSASNSCIQSVDQQSGQGQSRPAFFFLTQTPELRNQSVLMNSQECDQQALQTALNAGAQIFEPMHALKLYSCCNEISFYTWGEEQCELPVGATRATLEDKHGQLQRALSKDKKGQFPVLIFEERWRIENGQLLPGEVTHRHAVRLKSVTQKTDLLWGLSVVEIQWHLEDALPFSLLVGTVKVNGKQEQLSVVRGNVVLVDHGRTLTKSLPKPKPNQTKPSSSTLYGENGEINYNAGVMEVEKYNLVSSQENYRPRLQWGPLTQQGGIRNQQGQWVSFDPQQSAKAAIYWQLSDVRLSHRPPIQTGETKIWESWQLREVRPNIYLQEWSFGQELLWLSQRDLLNSDRFAREFVVETEDDGLAYLRFGDNVLGKKPAPGTLFQVSYRVGNGTLGNVGAEAIAHIYLQDPVLQNIKFKNIKSSNPLAAQGGIDPQTIEEVRRDAPQAFRQQRRAVTAQDYADLLEKHPEVQRAVATLRWTGSWYTLFITVDRQMGLSVDSYFQQQLRNFLEPFRLAGHDLKIEGPRFVPLDIALTVQVKATQFRSAVREALLQTFSNGTLPDGTLGFFHPDNFTFGQPLYLSQVVAVAMEVTGVESVEVTRFHRWQQPSRNEREIGQISFGSLEIAQVDNNPNAPENGKIEFDLRGGL